ncbi:MAG TPA: hypothetical protein VGM16_00050 [Gammaproteobacteria bacterium]|jgi:hypothetical protein
MRLARFAAVSPLLLLSGCAREYFVPPPAGPAVAEVTVVNTSTEPVSLIFYKDGSKCADQENIKDDAGVAPGASERVNVSGSEPATISLFTFSGGYPVTTSCRTTMTFRTTPGGAYRLVFGEELSRCGMAVLQLDPATGKYSKDTAVVHRLSNQPFFESDGWCLPMTAADRAKLAGQGN